MPKQPERDDAADRSLPVRAAKVLFDARLGVQIAIVIGALALITAGSDSVQAGIERFLTSRGAKQAGDATKSVLNQSANAVGRAEGNFEAFVKALLTDSGNTLKSIGSGVAATPARIGRAIRQMTGRDVQGAGAPGAHPDQPAPQ